MDYLLSVCIFLSLLKISSFEAFSSENNVSTLLEAVQDSETVSSDPEDDIFLKTSYIETSAVLLKVLDKITARVFEIRGNVGQKMSFGNLEIIPLACYKTPVDEKPESAAHLKMMDISKGKDAVIFSGWMFASSPSLSALEHPIYDVWVQECIGIERNPS